MGLAVFILSIIGVWAYMSHFWTPTGIGGYILWPIAGFCAIFSIYGGIIARSQAENEHTKARLLAATVISCLVLLGLTLSAIFLLIPAIR